MTVRHPDADRDASPAAVTVGTTTYSVDDDGVIDCPPEDERDVADVLSDVHDVDRGRILTNGSDGDGEVLVNDGPDYESIPPVLDDMTYDELYEVAADHDIKGRSEMTKDELIAALRERED